MRNIETIPVDKQKFIDILKKKGQTLQTAGDKIGRGTGYFSKRLSKYNSIVTTDAIALESIFGIKREQYIATEDEPEKTETKQTNVKVEIDYNKLQKTIYEAVYSAMINADRVIRESR